MINVEKYLSDAEWYCHRDPEEERFYMIFFGLCHKYNVRWARADEKERQFIEEVTRVTYERDKALRLGVTAIRSSSLFCWLTTLVPSSLTSDYCLTTILENL